MLRNYLKIAVRNILKYKTFSAINIFGLAVGMSVCMLIIMLVADQMMNDRHNKRADRIYRVNSIPFYDGNREQRGNENATTALPLKEELLTNYTGIEKAVRLIRGFGNSWIRLEPGNDINIPLSGYYADSEVLDVLDLELLYGNRQTALSEPYSVVITKAAAEKLFEMEDPTGQVLEVGEKGSYTVTGVLAKNENKSHIVAEAFASINTLEALATAGIMNNPSDDWYNVYSGWIYIMLEEGKDEEEVTQYLREISLNKYAKLPTPETIGAEFRLQPLLGITPGKLINNPIGPFMPWIIIYFLCSLAGIILLISCFNFTNLSIARSMHRAREIGVRKVTGAKRIQIFAQFISESIVLAMFSLVLALVFIILLKPMIQSLPFTQLMHWDLSANYVVYSVFVVLAMVIGIMAGLFPAVVLSGFDPVKVLKSMNNTKLMSKIGLRKALLVAQFTFSLIFILTVVLIYNQQKLFLTSDYGFDKEGKILIQVGPEYKALKNELLTHANLANVSAASHLPSSGVVRVTGFKKAEDWEYEQDLRWFSVDEDYIDNMKIPLLAGKFFSKEAGESNRNSIVINEAAAGALGYESYADALGKVVIEKSDSTEKVVIGVVKDYIHELASEKLHALALVYEPEEFRLLQIQYHGGYDVATDRVKEAWVEVNPGMKLDIHNFADKMGEIFNILFGSLIRVFSFIAGLAITIASLGLLGMATFTVETRRK